jgi:hypothetical protein
VHLLKSSRVDVPPGQPDVVCNGDVQQGPAWLTYQYSTSHPILRWSPSKLGLAKTLVRSCAYPPSVTRSGRRGNAILVNNLVPSKGGKGQLRTFWHSVGCELYSGRPKAPCYPFNLTGHRFRVKNRQGLHI